MLASASALASWQRNRGSLKIMDYPSLRTILGQGGKYARAEVRPLGDPRACGYVARAIWMAFDFGGQVPRRGFYTIILAATLIEFAVGFLPINPI
jgi:hypothetical protein